MKKATIIAFLIVALAPLTQAWADPGGGSKTYNYSATVNVVASGNGKVYVGTTNPLADKTKTSAQQSASNSADTSKTFTFYAVAEPDDGYEFTGWTGGADNASSSATPVTVSLSSTTTSKTMNLTAAFSKVLTFDGTEYVIDENGGDLATLLGTVQAGDKIVINKDVTIEKGVSLAIPSDIQVTVSSGKKLTVRGSLSIDEDARLIGDGTLAHNWKTITQAADVHVPFPLGTDGVSGTGSGVNTVDGTAGKYLVTSVKEESNVTGSFTCNEEFFVTVDNKAAGKTYYSKSSTSKPVGVLCTVAREKALNWIESVSDTVYTNYNNLLSAAQTTRYDSKSDHLFTDSNKLAVLTGDAGIIDSVDISGNSAQDLHFALDCAGCSVTFNSTSPKSQWNSLGLVRFFNGSVTISQKVMNTNFCVYNMSGSFGYLSGSIYYTAISLYDSPNVKVTWKEMASTTPAGGMNFYGGATYGIKPSGSSTANVSFNTTPSTKFNTVYWGTFVSGMNPTSYLYDTNKVYAEQDAKQSNAWVIKEVYVDQNAGQVLVNGEESSLADAIANASENSEIVLQKDVELVSDLTVATSGVRIDLNGWKLTGSNAIINNGDLEIIDVNGNGQIDAPIVNNGTLLLSSAKYNGQITLNSGFCYFLAGTFNGGVSVSSSVEDAKSVAEVCGGTYATLTYAHGAQNEALVGLCNNGYVRENAIAQVPESYVTNPSHASYTISALDNDMSSLYTRNAARSGYNRTEWIQLCRIKASSALFSRFGVDCAVTFDRDIAANDISVTGFGDLNVAIAANNSYSALFQAMRNSGKASAPWTYGAILPGGEHNGPLSFELSNSSAQNGTLCLLEMRLATGIRNMSGPKDWSYTEYVTTATRKFVLGAGSKKAMIRPETGAATFYSTLAAAVDAVAVGGTVMLANDFADNVTVGKACTIDTNGFAFTGEITLGEGYSVSFSDGKYVISMPDPADVLVEKVEVATIVEQVVSAEWLVANEISPDAEQEVIQAAVQEKLKEEDSNGNAKWENLVIGQKADEKAAVTAANGGTDKTATIEVSFEVPKDESTGEKIETGYTVKYVFDQVDTAGDVVENGAGEAKDEPTLDFASVETDTPTYFKMRAVLESNDDPEVKSEVEVEKTIGVLKVESAAEYTILAVPWQSLGTGDIKASELVHAASLSEDDELIVYNGDGSTTSWVVKDGKWTSPTEYTIGDGPAQQNETVDPSTKEIARGQGVWLKRSDTTKDIVLIGQPATNDEPVETPIAAATSEEDPTWNLVASPKMEAVDLQTAFTEAKGNTGDEIIVPTAGTPKHYTYKGDKWGYTAVVEEKEVWLPNGEKTISVKFGRKTNDTTVPAGQGFWYLNKDSSNNEKKITW